MSWYAFPGFPHSRTTYHVKNIYWVSTDPETLKPGSLSESGWSNPSKPKAEPTLANQQ